MMNDIIRKNSIKLCNLVSVNICWWSRQDFEFVKFLTKIPLINLKTTDPTQYGKFRELCGNTYLFGSKKVLDISLSCQETVHGDYFRSPGQKIGKRVVQLECNQCCLIVLQLRIAWVAQFKVELLFRKLCHKPINNWFEQMEEKFNWKTMKPFG